MGLLLPSPSPGFSAPLHSIYIQMAFCPGTPKEEFETATFWTPATLWDYNSLLRPPIGMRSKVNL
jgi:hypothetical protein